MPDEITPPPVVPVESAPATPEAPQNSPATIPPDRTDGDTDAGSKPGVLARIAAALPGRKRGPKGPWKHKPEAGATVPVVAPVAAPAVPAKNNSPLPAGFVKKALAGFLGVIDAYVVKKVRSVAAKRGAEPAQVKELSESVAMTKEETELISSLSELVARKHGLSDEIAPEALLIVAVAGYTTRTIIVLKQLEEMGKTQGASPKATVPAAPAAPPPPPEVKKEVLIPGPEI